MGKSLEEAGFMELALYGKHLYEAGRQTVWNPFPEYSAEELKIYWTEKREKVWLQGEIGFLSRKMELEEPESYLIFLAFLLETDQDFAAAFACLENGNSEWGVGRKLAKELYRYHQGDGELDQSLSRRRQWEPYLFGEGWTREKIRLSRPVAMFLKSPETWIQREAQEPSAGQKKLVEQAQAWGIRPQAERLAAYLKNPIQDKGECIVLTGPEGSGKRLCAETASALAGIPFFFLKNSEISEIGFETILKCALNEAVLCLSLPGKEGEQNEKAQAIISEGRRLLRAVFVLSGEETTLEGHASLFLKMEIPGLGERFRIWKREASGYPLADEVSLREMANKYALSPGQICRVLEMSVRQMRYHGQRCISEQILSEGCHCLLGEHFGNRASRVRNAFTWDDLVLPKRQKEKLMAACAQMRCRHKVLEEWGIQKKMPYGIGISLIFSGPPGTGKTMAAGILADQLGVELYKVRLAAVVSKFIGETEKNLEQIFEQAKKSQAALFFDEADALFGRRTEVKDSNDKYSNMEAAFLLQKIEEYDGIAILATNLLQNMDEAFRRRMKFIVDFPFPDPESRLAIWRRSIPRELPSGELDLEFLAESFELSGSGIRNVVYQAAFSAAAAGRSLQMGHLIRAIGSEYEKNGKTMLRKEAGPYVMDVEDLFGGGKGA